MSPVSRDFFFILVFCFSDHPITLMRQRIKERMVERAMERKFIDIGMQEWYWCERRSGRALSACGHLLVGKTRRSRKAAAPDHDGVGRQ